MAESRLVAVSSRRLCCAAWRSVRKCRPDNLQKWCFLLFFFKLWGRVVRCSNAVLCRGKWNYWSWRHFFQPCSAASLVIQSRSFCWSRTASPHTLRPFKRYVPSAQLIHAWWRHSFQRMARYETSVARDCDVWGLPWLAEQFLCKGIQSFALIEAQHRLEKLALCYICLSVRSGCRPTRRRVRSQESVHSFLLSHHLGSSSLARGWDIPKRARREQRGKGECLLDSRSEEVTCFHASTKGTSLIYMEVPQVLSGRWCFAAP